MTFEGDPYRTLGIEPGASVNEIRSAYRRLAKTYHPDAAGERALPRFLAIQAAYERLVDSEGRLRPVGWGRPGSTRRSGGGGAASSASGGDPWRADPARARASRDAWRARRGGASGGAAGGAPPDGATPGASGAPGPTGAPGPAGAPDDAGSGAPGGPGSANAGPPGATGPRSSRQGTGRPGSERHHSRRGPRKATPGSTSYDEAAENPLDPEWDGGAWYGPSSGTYWTLNPREYADPRKHGPEYLARARRAAAAGPEDARPGAGPSSAAAHDAGPRTDAAPDGGEWQWTGSAHTTTDGGAAEWGARGWSFETGGGGASWTRGPEARPGRAGGRPPGRDAGPGRPGEAAPPAPDAAPLPDLEALVRLAFPEHLLALALRDRRWRLFLALVAWPPIGYAIGGTVSAATGCSRYAVSCPDAVPVGLVLVQPLIVAAVYALPRITAVAAFAAIAALAMAIPVGAVLSVGALPRPQVEPLLLGVVVGATYLVALVGAALRLRVRDRPPAAGP